MSGRFNVRLTDKYTVEFWDGDTVGCFLLQWVPELLCLSRYFISEMSQSKTASSDCLSWRTESCCKDLNIKVFRSFSPRISNGRIGLSKLWEKEKESKNKHTQRNPPASRYFSCYSLEDTKFSRGNRKRGINGRHDPENMPKSRAHYVELSQRPVSALDFVLQYLYC